VRAIAYPTAAVKSETASRFSFSLMQRARGNGDAADNHFRVTATHIHQRFASQQFNVVSTTRELYNMRQARVCKLQKQNLQYARASSSSWAAAVRWHDVAGGGAHSAPNRYHSGTTSLLPFSPFSVVLRQHRHRHDQRTHTRVCARSFTSSTRYLDQSQCITL
jgi:hypothetical protein